MESIDDKKSSLNVRIGYVDEKNNFKDFYSFLQYFIPLRDVNVPLLPKIGSEKLDLLDVEFVSEDASTMRVEERNRALMYQKLPLAYVYLYEYSDAKKLKKEDLYKLKQWSEHKNLNGQPWLIVFITRLSSKNATDSAIVSSSFL